MNGSLYWLKFLARQRRDPHSQCGILNVFSLKPSEPFATRNLNEQAFAAVELAVLHPSTLDTNEAGVQLFAKQLEPYTRGLNLREVQIHLRTRASRFHWSTIQLRRSGNHQMEFNWLNNHLHIPPMSSYDMKVVRAQKFEHMYPYEIIRMLEGSPSTLNIPHPDMRQGRFQEYDFNSNGQFIPVLRAFGQNTCGVVVGIISNMTNKFPQGMQRVWIGSDSTKAMGR